MISSCTLLNYSLQALRIFLIATVGWWVARYLKEVDANETTLRFWQEIYDDQGKLVETHEKFPVDKNIIL